MISSIPTKQKKSRSYSPEIFVCGQEVAISIKDRESHSVRVSLENLVPMPKHVSFGVILDVVMPPEEKFLVVEDIPVSGRDALAFNRLGI